MHRLKEGLLVCLAVLIYSTPVLSATPIKDTDDPIRAELTKIEKEIENLREKILETKSKLLLLTEMFEKGTETGTMLSINLESQLPDDVTVRVVNVFVNGYQVYSGKNLKPGEKKNVYMESVAPGNFRVEVVGELYRKGGLFKKQEQVTLNEGTVIQVDRGLTSEVTITFRMKAKHQPELLFTATKKQTLPAVK